MLQTFHTPVLHNLQMDPVVTSEDAFSRRKAAGRVSIHDDFQGSTASGSGRIEAEFGAPGDRMDISKV